MIAHIYITDSTLKFKIKRQEIVLGGNSKLKSYGTLKCKSGKRMKKENRVFFASQTEAIQNNFRPCSHCMKTAYNQWIYSAPN